MRWHPAEVVSPGVKVGVGGAAVVGVAFGMARYAYGLTLPSIRAEFGLSELVLGAVASGTFLGYLLGLLAVPWLSARLGPRAPTTVGGVCGVLGAATVALAPTPGVLAAGAVLAGTAAGWVWAPYSDVVTTIVRERHQAAVLTVITTGTSVGLVALATAGLLAVVGSWRLTWAAVAVAAAAAALLNLRTVPPVPPPGDSDDDDTTNGDTTNGDGDGDGEDDDDSTDAHRPLLRPAMTRPLGYAALYFFTTTVYLTYASDAVGDGQRVTSAAVLVFALIGLGGFVALSTSRLARSFGASAVGGSSLVVVGCALVVIALGRASLPVVAVSALLFGAGFMVGSAVLDVWTAQAVADRPGDAFTLALVVGAVASIIAPAAGGVLIPVLTLPTVLLLVAAAAVAGGVAVMVARRRPAKSRTDAA